MEARETMKPIQNRKFAVLFTVATATFGLGGAPAEAKTTAATAAPTTIQLDRCERWLSNYIGLRRVNCNSLNEPQKTNCLEEQKMVERYRSDPDAMVDLLQTKCAMDRLDAAKVCDKAKICGGGGGGGGGKKSELYHQRCHPAQVKLEIAEQVGSKKKPKDMACECTNGHYALGLGEFVLCMPQMPKVVAGPQGPSGDKGDPGDRGPQGPKGDPGQDGEDGTDGTDGVDGELSKANLLTLIQQLIDSGELRLPSGGASLPSNLPLDKLLEIVRSWDQLLRDVAQAKQDAAMALGAASKNVVAIKIETAERKAGDDQLRKEIGEVKGEVAKLKTGERQFHFGVGGFLSWKPPVDKAPGEVAGGAQLHLDWDLIQQVAISVNLRVGGVKIGGPIDDSALYVDLALGPRFRLGNWVVLDLMAKVDDNLAFGGKVVNGRPVDSLGYNGGLRVAFALNLLNNHLRLGVEGELLYGHATTFEAAMPQPNSPLQPQRKVVELNGMRGAVGFTAEIYF